MFKIVFLSIGSKMLSEFVRWVNCLKRFLVFTILSNPFEVQHKKLFKLLIWGFHAAQQDPGHGKQW